MKIKVAELLNWSEGKRVSTKNGDRILRKAEPTGKFWEIYKASKDELKKAGISIGKDARSGNWEVCFWQPLDTETVAAENAAKEASRAVNANIEIPVNEGLEYLPFQKAGIAYAISRPNCLIADEMGLGKTVQAIGVINTDKAIRKVLVVCPASLKLNWKREMQKWLTRKFTMIAICDAKRFIESADICIINYDVLTKHPAINEIEFDLLIADECHYAKNPKAKRSKALYAIKAKRKLFLTGTPITNRPVELHPIASALDSETFGNFWAFAKRYCNAYNSGWGWDFSGASNLDELQDKLRRTIMVRRLKSEVLKELPAKRRQVIELEPNGTSGLVEKEKALYAAHRAKMIELKAMAELAKAQGQSEYNAAVERLKYEAQIGFTELSRVRHELALAKVPKVIEHINELLDSYDNYKVVVFAHHKDVVSALMKEFGSKAVAVVGDTKIEDRQKAVDSFQNNPKIQVFVGSIRAAGVGLTLTASSHVVFAELDWTPANMSQAEDRCHRIGQVNSVLVQHLVFDGSLDVKFAKTLVAKQAVIEKALDSEIPETELQESVDEIEVATKTLSVEKIEKAVIDNPITEQRRETVHRKIKYLQSMCDGAFSQDGTGFNKFDAPIGKALSLMARLTDKQVVLAEKLAHKYRKQLEAE